MEKRVGRPQLVSDEDIRRTVIALLNEGVKPVVAKVRARLIETKNHGGEPARISRLITEVTSSLASAAQGPLGGLNIPDEILKPAGDMVIQMYALANKQALQAGEAYREEVERKAAEEIGRANEAADALRHANAAIEGRLEAAMQKAAEMEATQAQLVSRIEQLTVELAAARATLDAERQAHSAQTDTTNRRILELEDALKAKPPQPVIDMDALVDRLAQVTKGKVS